MILIADSGSTKTDWRLVDGKKITQLRTAGLNPYHISKEDIAAVIQSEFRDKVNAKDVAEVFFYGAGCSNEEKCGIVESAIGQTFTNAAIHVDHDLMAAARALCGKEAGIAAILGTGSNSCIYDGEKITAHIPSLGYVLGDEGSGVHIGKKFLQSFLYDELPVDLKNTISAKHPITIGDVLENIYRKPQPNRYISSFSDIVHKHIAHPFLIKMVYGCFEEFFNHHICKYEGYNKVQVHAVGSIAYFYSHIFKAIALDKGIAVGRILQTPIAGLTLYHAGEIE
jgi:glucosamine kinase